MASKRKRGRPKRALSSAEKARRRREGLLPTGRFSTQRRLANIRWSAGTLTSAQRLLVTTIVNTSKEEHGGEALFGQNSFAIVGSRRGYDALKKLVVELAAGKQIAEDLPPHAQPSFSTVSPGLQSAAVAAAVVVVVVAALAGAFTDASQSVKTALKPPYVPRL